MILLVSSKIKGLNAQYTGDTSMPCQEKGFPIDQRPAHIDQWYYMLKNWVELRFDRPNEVSSTKQAWSPLRGHAKRHCFSIKKGLPPPFLLAWRGSAWCINARPGGLRLLPNMVVHDIVSEPDRIHPSIRKMSARPLQSTSDAPRF